MEDDEPINHTENLAQQIQDTSESQALSSDNPTYWTPINYEEIHLKIFTHTKLQSHIYARSFVFQPESSKFKLTRCADAYKSASDCKRYFSYFHKSYFISRAFSSFKILFEKPLLRVKSLQLLSAIIPNPNPSIPDDECAWWYYRF
jgi:hypothetical protein